MIIAIAIVTTAAIVAIARIIMAIATIICIFCDETEKGSTRSFLVQYFGAVILTSIFYNMQTRHTVFIMYGPDGLPSQ